MKDHKGSRVLIVAPVVLFVVTAILTALGVAFGWFGTARGGVMAFCEQVHPGYIKQPANAVSNIAFSMAGLLIGWLAYKRQGKSRNLFNSSNFFPLLLSCGMVILGAGSFAMHATDTMWGGFADLFGMYMFSSFVASYALARWLRWGATGFTLLFVVNLALGSYVKLTQPDSITWLPTMSPSSSVFSIHLLVAIVFEILLHYGRGLDISPKLGWGSVFVFAASFLVWNLSRNQTSPLCDPHLWLQGHALWHILDASAAVVVYLFYNTENNPEFG